MEAGTGAGVLFYSRGLCYKTLQIRKLHKMGGLRSKLGRFVVRVSHFGLDNHQLTMESVHYESVMFLFCRPRGPVLQNFFLAVITSLPI